MGLLDKRRVNVANGARWTWELRYVLLTSHSSSRSEGAHSSVAQGLYLTGSVSSFCSLMNSLSGGDCEFMMFSCYSEACSRWACQIASTI